MISKKCLAIKSNEYNHVLYFTEDNDILNRSEWLKNNCYIWPIRLFKDTETGIIYIAESIKYHDGNSFMTTNNLHCEHKIFYNMDKKFKTDIFHWSKFSQSELESKLIDMLPHGSGINGNWQFNYLKNGKIKAYNFYHGMDEFGFYCHMIDFYLTLHVNHFFNFVLEDIHLTKGCKEYLCCAYDIKNYIYETTLLNL